MQASQTMTRCGIAELLQSDSVLKFDQEIQLNHELPSLIMIKV